MKVSAAKENILKKIRQALSESTPIPFPQSEGRSDFFTAASEEPEVEFAERFTSLLGKFIFCADHREMTDQLQMLAKHFGWKHIFCREEKLQQVLHEHNFSDFSSANLGQCDAAITSCEMLIARTGSIVMSTAQQSGRTVSVYAPVHICIAYTNQLVYDISDGLQAIRDKYKSGLPSFITVATGPSRTADIEKTLVVGVHGPKEVYVLLVDNQAG
jgi:L-lactate dehydrogenase complex protein LldG